MPELSPVAVYRPQFGGAHRQMAHIEMQARPENVERVKQGAFHPAIVVGFRIVRDETVGSQQLGARDRQTILLRKPLGDGQELFPARKPHVTIEVVQSEPGAKSMHNLSPKLGFDFSLAGFVQRPRRTPLRPVGRRSSVIAPPPKNGRRALSGSAHRTPRPVDPTVGGSTRS